MKKFSLQRLRVRRIREWRARTFIFIVMACAAAYPSIVMRSRTVPTEQELRVIHGVTLINTKNKNSGVTFFINVDGVNQHWFVPSHAFNRDVAIHTYIENLSDRHLAAKIGVYEKNGRHEVWKAEVLGREVYSYKRAVEVFELDSQLWGYGRAVSFLLLALAVLSIFKVETRQIFEKNLGEKR